MTATQRQDDTLTDGKPVKKRLKLRDRAFRDLHAQGLPHYKLNSRTFRYRWSEIEQWLAERRRGGAVAA